MKKILCSILIIVSMLSCGIALLCTGSRTSYAHVVGTSGAQFVLTGYTGNAPESYFTDLNNNSTLSNAQVLNPDKNYINKKGQAVNTYRYITGQVKSASKKKSYGVAAVYPTAEMFQIIQAGFMQARISCGLLALADNDRSKVTVTMSIIAADQVYSTQTLTSNKVSSNNETFEPEWVETGLINLPTNTQRIEFSFENKDGGTLTKASKFCIFEPTIFFATNLSAVEMSEVKSNAHEGEIIKLSGSNFITSISEDSTYFDYYKNIHAVTFEITQGSDIARISGNYLYVNTDAANGSEIKVRARCRKSSGSAEYIYTEVQTITIDNTQVNISVDADFAEPAVFSGEGNYYVGSYATLSASAKQNFDFVGWVVSGKNYSQPKITILVDEKTTVKALFTKTISITEISVNSKTYDGTSKAVISQIKFDGVEQGHDVRAEGLEAEFATAEAGENISIKLNGTPKLVGGNKDLYILQDQTLPQIVASIWKKNLVITSNSFEKIYGDADPALTYTASGLVAGEKLQGSLSRENGEDVGTYTTTIGDLVERNPNYSIEFTSNKFTIKQRKISLLNISAQPKVYDKKTDADINVIINNIIKGDDAVVTIKGEYDNANAGVNKTITLSVSLTGSDAKNYYLANFPSVIYGTIEAKPVMVKTYEQNFVYGDKIQIQYTLEGLEIGDTTEGELSILQTNAGRHLITLGTLKNSNYKFNLEEVFVNITPKDVYVSANNLTKIYQNADPILTYIAQGLVEGDSLSGSIARESGENVGEYKISQGTLNNSNYNIFFTSGVFTITKRPLEISFNVSDKIYDGTTEVDYDFTLSNVALGEEVEVSTALSFEDKDVGTNKKIIYSCEILGESKNNYQIEIKNEIFASILQKNVEIKANSIEKFYGQNDPTLSIEYVGKIKGEEIIQNLFRDLGENVGIYNYEISEQMKIDNPNYNLSLQSKITLSIKAKDISISVESAQKQYGNDDPIYKLIYDKKELQFEDDFTKLLQGALTRVVGEEIGRYDIEQGTLSLGANYNITFTPGILTIVKRDIVAKVQDCEKVYGENDPKFNIVLENALETTPSSIQLRREKGEDVGNYNITYQSLDDAHYNIEFIAGTLKITPCPITVQVEDSFKYYGEEDPQMQYILTGGRLCWQDLLEDVLSGECSRDAGENAGTYTLNQGTLKSNSNYELTFVKGKLFIYPKALSIKIKDSQKYYGEKDPEFELEVLEGELINEEDFFGRARREFGENVGDYVIEVGTLSTTENYTFSYTCGILKILPRPITITASPAEKVYGEVDPVFSYSITEGSIVNGDELVGAIYRENVGTKIYENVGKYELLCSISDINYDIKYVSAYLTIVQREIQVNSQDYTTIYGDPVITEFEYEITGDILEGDELTGKLYKTDGFDAGVYQIRSTLNLGRNYKIKYVPAIYEILPVKLKVSLGYNEKTYSHPDPLYNLTIVDGKMVGGEELAFDTTRDCSEDIGEYALTCISLDPNYEIETLDSSLVIMKKDVNLVVTLLDKPYDATDKCNIKNAIVSGLVDNELILKYDPQTCARFTSCGPGDNIAVELIGFSLEGQKAKNYNLVIPTNLTANITYDKLEDKNIEVSTYSSTAMKKGTTLNVSVKDAEELYQGKRVVNNFNVSLNDANGNALVLDKALTMKINIQNLNECNNIKVYGKNAKGDFVALSYIIENDEIIVSTSVFSDFIVVCDNEIWIDIAMAAFIGLFVGMALCYVVISSKKKINSNKTSSIANNK